MVLAGNSGVARSMALEIFVRKYIKEHGGGVVQLKDTQFISEHSNP